MVLQNFSRALVAVGFGAFSSMASAALIATIPGNDCAGVFGQSFSECRVPAQYDPNETPVIIKFDEQGGFEINTNLFPSITGGEFTFSGFGSSGTWTYNPGPNDPAINFFVAKGGNFFNLFSNLGDPLTDSWFTPTNPANGQPFGLSHLTFYDTTGPGPGPGPGEGGKVPEPSTLLLLGIGVLATGLARRRVKPK